MEQKAFSRIAPPYFSRTYPVYKPYFPYTQVVPTLYFPYRYPDNVKMEEKKKGG